MTTLSNSKIKSQFVIQPYTTSKSGVHTLYANSCIYLKFMQPFSEIHAAELPSVNGTLTTDAAAG